VRFIWPKTGLPIARRCQSCERIFSVAVLPPLLGSVKTCPFCASGDVHVIQAEVTYVPLAPADEGGPPNG
jgi:Zn finger protein HypA/HybF involved in hydrogenase expression